MAAGSASLFVSKRRFRKSPGSRKMTTVRSSAPPTPIRFLVSSILLCLSASMLHAGPVVSNTPERPGALHRWLSGKYGTGDWWGLRNDLSDRGIEFNGNWKGTFYGLTSGGLDSPRGAFDQEIYLGLTLDLGKLAGIDGLTLQGGVRYRDGRNPNAFVGASSTFSPTRYQSGQLWRLMPFFFTYTTPELFGVKNLLTLSGGWQNPYTVFADQPESKLFTNNAIGTTKGIGGVNGFPMGSSYAAWGGYFKVKPVDWYYAMAGLYLAIPEATTYTNHGLDFAGYGPDPSRNGLYFLAETGFTPALGPDRLPGKYAFGTIYWGIENTSFNGEIYDQKYTFYWQADQMLFREPTAPATDSTPHDFSGKALRAAETRKLSDQGLYAFSFINYAPAYDNAMPFYFHVGLVYKGLIPRRDKDQLGVAFGYGNYSYDQILADERAGQDIRQTDEGVVEVDYRIQLTSFAYVQPFWQYIIRPNGDGVVHNANILGLHMGVTF